MEQVPVMCHTVSESDSHQSMKRSYNYYTWKKNISCDIIVSCNSAKNVWKGCTVRIC